MLEKGCQIQPPPGKTIKYRFKGVNMTKTISFDAIREAVAGMAVKSNLYLPDDVACAITAAAKSEDSPLGQEMLRDILKNHQVAAEQKLPLCQDTGTAVVFIELGQDAQITGGLLYDAINQGIAQGYQEGFLRKSIVEHPWLRKNTGNNTPAIIHTEIIAGDGLKITLAPKGGGSENMSALAMLTPAAGKEGVKNFVINTVKKAGPNPCPPIVVGVGVGGNFEKAAYLAKKALLRPLGEDSQDEEAAILEKELLQEINTLGIGPQGFGGKTTALAVHIETFPCHIASMPVAVNINCHVARHLSVSF